MAIREEDTYKYQADRLKKLISERAPGRVITFDETRNFIHFRVTDSVTGTELVEPKGEWEPSELADKSDKELWSLVQRLSNGKL